MESLSSVSSPHVVLFPFMAKGHTIPILHLARLLLHRHITITIFSTPANHTFISDFLSDTTASISDLPFPENVSGIPEGVESTDQLPSFSLFFPFAKATKLMQPHFERALEILLPVSFLVSDAFLFWTLQSASKFGIPRLVFYGMNNYSLALVREVAAKRLIMESESDDELFTVPTFPWIKLSRNDFESWFRDSEHPEFDFVKEVRASASKSFGLVVNSFYELEHVFLDYWNRKHQPKAWSVGPLCLAEPPKGEHGKGKKPMWVQWLDQKLAQGKSVLYVAFGSQADISQEQFKEISTGLEESKVNFLWVVRKKELKFGDGFEERVKQRGIVVREWVDQWEILHHESIQGFLSHCGWNSVLESICAGVPVLAWPMMAEQHLNARMVVEEIKVGLRVETCDGSVRGFVKREGLQKMAKELMEGEMGKEVRKKVKEVAEAARKAVEEGGSSWLTLKNLIDDKCKVGST